MQLICIFIYKYDPYLLTGQVWVKSKVKISYEETVRQQDGETVKLWTGMLVYFCHWDCGDRVQDRPCHVVILVSPVAGILKQWEIKAAHRHHVLYTDTYLSHFYWWKAYLDHLLHYQVPVLWSKDTPYQIIVLHEKSYLSKTT